MSERFDLARDILLVPAGIDESQLEAVLGKIMAHQVDYADLYFETSRFESWSLEDGIVKEGGYSIERGVGVRAVSGEKTGFAYSDEIYLPALTEAALSARAIAKSGQQGRVKAWGNVSTGRNLYPSVSPFESLAEQDKVALMEAADAEARAQDSRVKQVMVSLVGAHKVIMVAASDGTLGSDIRPLVRMSVSVVVEDNGRREQGSSGGGARLDYGFFIAEDRAKGYAREAVRQALINLDARDAPAGPMPVVLGSGWPGVLLHEAVGHGLEGDFNRKGTSAFSGKMGQKVASELCTIVDDGTLQDRRGSLNIDDEGVQSNCTTLIENGILTAYIQDKMNARLMGVEPTGNGRRESYAHLPLPRMTNTYMLPGNHTPEEMIASVDKGLYAVNFGGGQVDITSGKFVFSASEAYMIENGKVTYPVKGATLIGNGPEAMHQVSMVGNDLKLDEGVGTCGKEGQSIPVGVGQPSMKIDGITVGGTSAG